MVLYLFHIFLFIFPLSNYALQKTSLQLMLSYLSYKEFSQSVHIIYDIHLLSDEILNVNIFFVTTAVFSFSSGKNVIL